MERRRFLSSLIGTGVAAAAGISPQAAGQARTAEAVSPEFYVWRQYVVRNGTQPRRLADFLHNAAIPALNRLGRRPIGVFEVVAGVPSPTFFMMTPLASADALGRFRIAGLPGGERYLAVATDYLEESEHTDPGFLERMIDSATGVQLAEGEARVVNLTVVER